MPIRYHCNACGELLSVGSRMAGRELECPACGAPTRVPASSPEDRDSITRRRPEMPARMPAAEEPIEEEAVRPAIEPDPAELPQEPFVSEPQSERRRPVPASAEGFSLGMKRPTDQEEMDLTPMVDMTFLLLIFFMITASFSVQKSLEVPPPSADKKGAAQSIQSLDDLTDTSIAVRIDDRNIVYIDDEPLPGSMRLTDALQQKFSSQRNELLLTADDAALHDTVVSVIDAANEVGVQKIRMTAGRE